MHIYIDESGSFAIPKKKILSVSCISALIIPEISKDEIFRNFKNIVSKWGMEDREIKGSKLNENQISLVISMLCKHDVIVKACIIDMGLHLESQITKHKINQAKAIIENVTSKFHPNFVKGLNDLKARLEKLSNQLYVQAVMLTCRV